MGFLKSNAEIARDVPRTPEIYNAEVLTVAWETKPRVVRRFLPPPLEPATRPLVVAFVAHYPSTNFGPPYSEGGLFLRCVFNGEEGNYCLAMHVTDDMAMAGGRERWGFPKKMAHIEFGRKGEAAHGWLARHDRRFFEVQARISGEPNLAGFRDVFAEFSGGKGEGTIFYLFKHFFAPEGGFDYRPRLVRQVSVLPRDTIEFGEAAISLEPSDADPWYQVEIVETLGGAYSIGNATMVGGSVVAEVDSIKFAPYSFVKWDW